MSVTDPNAEPVQPDVSEGQGGAGGDAPYAEYLNRIPEEARGAAEEAFKAWDANLTPRFQEASEYKRSWEPYEQLGVNQLPPDQVEWALGFHQAATTNPQAVQEWYQAYAQQHGLQAAQQAAEEFSQQPADESLLGYDPQVLQQHVQQAIQPMQQQLEQMAQWREQQEYQAREQEAQAFVESQLEALKSEPGFDREGVEMFVANHMDNPTQAVKLAFEDFQRFRGNIERQFAQSKVDTPAAPESGGGADVSVPERHSLSEANDRARAMLAQMNRQ